MPMSVIWNNCLAKLEHEIPSTDFSTWIRPLQAVETDSQLKLLAPNRFIIDHIKQHFFATIEDAVNEFSNATLAVQFEIGSKKIAGHQSTNTQQESDPKEESTEFFKQSLHL
jgi:ATPase involved in DNA replication initiation